MKSKIRNIFQKIFFLAICLLIFSCNKDKTSADSIFSIGQSHGGGIIFYLDGTGKHGLIAAPFDQSTSIQWNNGSFVPTNTNQSGIGKGRPNTTAIVTAQGVGIYAASICDQLVLNGYSDWFLPAKNELNLLYQQRNLVGGFSYNNYWSSSEYDTQRAWYQFFPYGVKYYAEKPSMACIRAIRAF